MKEVLIAKNKKPDGSVPLPNGKRAKFGKPTPDGIRIIGILKDPPDFELIASAIVDMVRREDAELRSSTSTKAVRQLDQDAGRTNSQR